VSRVHDEHQPAIRAWLAGRGDRRRLTALALSGIGALVVACGTSGASASADGDVPPPPAAECAILQPPGPRDAPPPGGEIDVAGQGPGRFRLCLGGPSPLSVEGTAWCSWDAARQSVVAVSGLPTPAGTVDYEAFLQFETGGYEVHLTDRTSGVIANYVPRSDPTGIGAEPGQVSGLLPVDVVIFTGGEPAPPGAPQALQGRVRWACGDPPAT
jgi:hypothetical protein